MRARGYQAALLKPFSQDLFNFYRRSGYETLSSAISLERGFDPKAPTARLIEPSPAAMLAAFEAFTKGYDGVIGRTEEDFTLLIEEAGITGSPVYASATAYALGERIDGRLELTEVAGAGIPELVNAVAKAEGEKVFFQVPSDHDLAKRIAARTV